MQLKSGFLVIVSQMFAGKRTVPLLRTNIFCWIVTDREKPALLPDPMNNAIGLEEKRLLVAKGGLSVKPRLIHPKPPLCGGLG